MKSTFVLFIFTVFAALAIYGCGSTNNNNPPSVSVTSTATPAPSASASATASPSPSASPIQTVFRSLQLFVDCGPVTPGTCTPKDYVVDSNGHYLETEAGNSGDLSQNDFTNIVSQVNAFWAKYATAQLVCQEPPTPLVGGHAESLSIVVGNPTQLLYSLDPSGRECGRGNLAEARTLDGNVKTILFKYH